MAAKLHTTTEADIRAAVVAKGFADATVTRQYVKDRIENHGTDGEWFVLSVQTATGDWNVWGRRRTLADLRLLAVRGPLC